MSNPVPHLARLKTAPRQADLVTSTGARGHGLEVLADESGRRWTASPRGLPAHDVELVKGVE